jgi:hypothetical protein
MQPKRSGNRTIFHGAKLTLRTGTAIKDVRTAMGLGDSQVRQEEGDRLGSHRGTTIGMQGEQNRRPFIRSITHPPDQTSKMNGKKLTQSSTDGENFVHVFPELAGAQVEKNQILGQFPYRTGGCRAPCRCIWGSLSLNRLSANRMVSAHTSPSAATIRHTWALGRSPVVEACRANSAISQVAARPRWK